MEDSDERSKPMKRNGLFVLVLALAAVLCTGCGVKDEDLKSDPLVNADGIRKALVYSRRVNRSL